MKLPFDPEDLRQFWDENQHIYSADILLKTRREEMDKVKILIQQVNSRKRLLDKVPEWANRYDLDLPPATNLSQSSSTLTARYKSQFVSGNVLDLTAGSGIDAWQLGQSAENLTIVEPNEELLERTSKNLSILGIAHEAIHSTAESHIQSSKKTYDCIYIDPSRKTDDGKKTVALHRMMPDISTMWSELLLRSQVVLVKLSPLFDLTAIVTQLKGVFAIDVVSKKGEVKEILVRAKRDYSGEVIVCYSEVERSLEPQYSAKFSQIQSHLKTSASGEWKGYLYDPAPGLLKAGLSDLWSHEHNLSQPFKGISLYTSAELVSEFPGRIFKIVQTGKPYKLLNLPKQLSIVTRNYFESPEKIRRRIKVKESDEQFLFACTENRKNSIFIHTLRVN